MTAGGLTTQSFDALLSGLQIYLDLLLRWNSRTNLTAVREPEAIVQRHFGESLFAGFTLAGRLFHGASLLDYGSGAGFPGLPIQLLFPGIQVTLAESQGKKAAFLREVVRELGTTSRVWASRVEEMPVDLRFHAVTMRAVDRSEKASSAGWARVAEGGCLLRMGVVSSDEGETAVRMPGPNDGALVIRAKI